ncbi:MAG: HlyC/CorC family transporter [Chlorobi bacterium]|nr:HlyC/CorC family transporter [Chlorobiota bacterium]
MAVEIFALIFLLLLSAFFSSTELAFVVANKIKLEIRSKQNKLAEKSAMYFVDKPQIFFSTILISNNVVNIAFASLVTIFLQRLFNLGNISILLISTFSLLLFGELLPKYFAREYADTLIKTNAVPLRIVSILIYPFAKITASLSNVFVRTDLIQEEEIQVLEKEDLQILIDESSAAGKVSEEDSEIISNIFELGEQKIYEAMTPRTEIEGVEINSGVDEAIDKFIETGYSKLPVYEENLDNVKGVVIAYDMFKNPKTLKEVIRDVVFVPETKMSMDMLNELLEKRISIAIVVDEFGGTAGLITVEDILEEMLGEIMDEYDEEEEVCKKIEENVYVISGRVEIDFINDKFEFEIPEGDYETIAGFIMTNIGRIPKKGETVEIGKFKIQILHSDETKINLVKLFVKEPK